MNQTLEILDGAAGRCMLAAEAAKVLRSNPRALEAVECWLTGDCGDLMLWNRLQDYRN